MKQDNIIWGVVLILVGLVLTLDLLLPISLWGIIWPLALIVVGALLIVRTLSSERGPVVEQMTVPLEGALRLQLTIRHGAGRLTIGPGALPVEALSGRFGGGVVEERSSQSDALRVDLRQRGFGWRDWGPWAWTQPNAAAWQVRLNERVPIALDVKGGANECRMDLTDLRVTDLNLETGASSTEVMLPADAEHTRVRVRTGMASVTLRVPEGVAARIRGHAGMGALNVDRARFPKTGDGVYQSPDYDTARNTVEVDAEAGMAEVAVR